MDSEVLVLDRDDLILLFQQKPEAALHMLASLSGLTRKADELLRTRVSRNVNEEMEVHSTLLQRMADWIAQTHRCQNVKATESEEGVYLTESEFRLSKLPSVFFLL